MLLSYSVSVVAADVAALSRGVSLDAVWAAAARSSRMRDFSYDLSE